MKAKLRFEVLKRDLFTCGYCGRTPPAVLLHVDHIVPKSAGGSDALHNLSTSCVECNQGKGSRLLAEGTAPSVNAKAVAEMRERVKQAEAYQALVASQERLLYEALDAVTDRWCVAFGGKFVADEACWRCDTHFPEEASVRRFLREMPLDHVLGVVDLTASKCAGLCGKRPSLYFYKVCWNLIRAGRSALAERTKP